MNKTVDKKTGSHTVVNRKYDNFRKWILRIPLYFLFGIMLLIGTGVLLLQTGMVRNILRGFLVETVNKQLNATVNIERINGNLLTDISLEGVSLKTPDDKPVLLVEKISARYLLPALLAKVLHVGNIRIEGLRLNGTKSRDGEWNFSTLLHPSDKKEKSSDVPFPFLVAIKRFDIEDALLVLEESGQETATTRSFRIDRFIAGIKYEETLQLSILESFMALNTQEMLPIAIKGRAVFNPKTIGVDIDHLVIQSGPSIINVDGEFRFPQKSQVIDCRIGLEGVDLGNIGRKLAVSGLPEVVFSGDLTIKGTPTDVRHQILLREDGGGVLEIDGSSGFENTRGFWTDLSGSIRTLDLSELRIPAGKYFSGVVSSDFSLKGTDLQKPNIMDAGISIAIRGISAAGIPLDVIRLNADWSKGEAGIDRLEVVSGKDQLGLSGIIKPFERNSGLDLALHLEQPEVLLGRLSNHLSHIPAELTLTGETDINATVGGWLETPQVHLSVKTPNIAYNHLTIEMLDLTGDLQGLPSADDGRANLVLTADGVRMDGIESGTLSLSGSWKGPFQRYAAHAELNAQKIDIKNNRLKGLFLTADVTPDEAILSASAGHENGSLFEIDGKAAPWATPEKDITISHLRLDTHSPWPESNLVNSEPLRFSQAGGNHIEVRACNLTLNETKIGIEGNLAASGGQDLAIIIDNLELQDIPGKWNDAARLSGTVSTKTNIRGTLDRPIISAFVDVKKLVGYGITQDGNLKAAVDYAGGMAALKATLMKGEVPVFDVDGNVPVRFSLRPFLVAEVPGNLKATLETRNLRFSELPIPRTDGVEWDAVADMNLHASGTIRKPDFAGDIDIHDGYLTLNGNKLTYEQVGAKLLLSTNRLTVEELTIGGDREGRLMLSGMIVMDDWKRFEADLTVNGDNFYIPFQKAVSARISPKLHLTGGLDNPSLMGEVTITESKVNLDRLAQQQYSDIQVVDTAPEGGDAPLVIDSEPDAPDFLSPLSADIIVRVPKNAWLKGQDVNAEIAGEIAVRKEPGRGFLLSGPLHTLRGNYYFMGKNFNLSKGNVEFLGLKEMNPNLNIEARTRIKSTEIIVSLHGPANEIAIDLSSDPAMEESDIISYLVFGRSSDNIGGNQAFNVEKAALSITGGLLAGELRNLLGDVFFIDSFAIDSGDSENGFGSVTLGKYITPEIFVSHRQGLTENDASYEEITYELTPQLKLEAQIGRDNTSSADLTWEFDF